MEGMAAMVMEDMADTATTMVRDPLKLLPSLKQLLQLMRKPLQLPMLKPLLGTAMEAGMAVMEDTAMVAGMAAMAAMDMVVSAIMDNLAAFK
jgi:hypothetical protein